MAEFEIPQAAYHAAAALTGESRARLAAAAPYIAAAAVRQAVAELLALISEALLMLEHGERPDGAPTDPARETWYGWAQRAEVAWRAAQR